MKFRRQETTFRNNREKTQKKREKFVRICMREG